MGRATHHFIRLVLILMDTQIMESKKQNLLLAQYSQGFEKHFRSSFTTNKHDQQTLEHNHG